MILRQVGQQIVISSKSTTPLSGSSHCMTPYMLITTSIPLDPQWQSHDALRGFSPLISPDLGSPDSGPSQGVSLWPVVKILTGPRATPPFIIWPEAIAQPESGGCPSCEGGIEGGDSCRCTSPEREAASTPSSVYFYTSTVPYDDLNRSQQNGRASTILVPSYLSAPKGVAVPSTSGQCPRSAPHHGCEQVKYRDNAVTVISLMSSPTS